VSAGEPTSRVSADPAIAAPGPAELLRATLEKVVFFEWRVRELTAELAAAAARASAAERERIEAAEAGRAAAGEAQALRRQAAELESERARLAALLARPLGAPAADAAALEAERARTAQLSAELDEARRQIARHKDERSRWLNEMIAQARSGDEAPAALAQFISELRGEVIALRERQRQTDALLEQAGIPPPPASGELGRVGDGANGAPPQNAHPGPDPVQAAQALWDEGRLGGLNAALDQATAASAALAPRPQQGAGESGAGAPAKFAGGASRALAEQCLRGLLASDPARRAQAARHLAALPLSPAAPALAAALARETEPHAKAAIARALVACGAETAAQMVQRLLGPEEPALVRLSALEALAEAGGDRGVAALEAAARDPSPALRRRAASLALERGGNEVLLSRLSADADRSVRAAARAEVATAAKAAAVDRPAQRDDQRPEATANDFGRDAVHAVRAAMFGLTESELASAVGLADAEASDLAERLVRDGWLARRGRRLIVGGAAPRWEERGARG
jgi:chemotaxis protein MotB